MKRLQSIIILILIIILLRTALTPAQEETEEKAPERPPTIIVDRPSFANSSLVVGEGVNSLETGILITDSKGNSALLTQTPFCIEWGSTKSSNFDWPPTFSTIKIRTSDWAIWRRVSNGTF